MQDESYQDLTRELWGTSSRWNSKRTYAELARELRVDDENARKRVRRLKESGYLLGWRLVPNPSLLDRKSALVLLEFENDSSKEEAIPRLKKTDGVTVIAKMHGPSIMLTTFEKEIGKLKWGQELAGNTRARIIPGLEFSVTDDRMTPTDWAIVYSLVRNAERDVDELAGVLRFSSRTIRWRLDKMLAASAIFVMPMVDLRLVGGVSIHVLLECDKGRVADIEGHVSSEFPNLMFRARTSNSGLVVGLLGRNVSEASEAVKRVKRFSGVRTVTFNITEEVDYVFRWLERETKKRSASSHE